MPRLGVIIASVRKGRAGGPVADWFIEVARTHGGFEVEGSISRSGRSRCSRSRCTRGCISTESEKTRQWSAAISALDAFAIVTPEYNYSSPPALVNAIDHLYTEWNYKAAGLVSYGGISGGLRAAQMTKTLLAAVKIVPIVEAVALPMFSQQIDKASGAFKATAAQEKSAIVMLDELRRWTGALAALRT